MNRNCETARCPSPTKEMNPNETKPVPTPLSQRWRQFRTQVMPVLVFLAAATIVVILWERESVPSRLVGEVYAPSSELFSPRSGLVESLNFAPFDVVQKGDVIAVIRWTPEEQLVAERAMIEAEIRLSELGGLDPVLDQQRNLLNWQSLRNDWVAARGRLDVLEVQRAQARRDWQRAQNLHDADHLSASEYERLENLYRSLDVEVEATRRQVRVLEEASRLSRIDPDSDELDWARVLEATRWWQHKRLELLEAEARPLMLRAPITGVITQIYQQEGGYVAADTPLAIIRASEAPHILGYLRQPTDSIPVVGTEVEVITRGDRKLRAAARILEVGPQFEPLGPAFIRPFATQEERALPLLISIPEGLDLRPGEIVDLRLTRQ